MRDGLIMRGASEEFMRGNEFFKRMASAPPFSRLHPRLAGFFEDYLTGEKVIRFGGRHVLNTHFPPWPSPAFDRLVEQFNAVGDSGPEQRLFSVTWAVTNRCRYHCWHCYNAGRSQQDLPQVLVRRVAGELRDLGVLKLTLTGGEPLLRGDLEEIAGSFDESTTVGIGTSGDGLTPERARSLRSAGVFSAGLSLDSADEGEHDRLRGRPGAFRAALSALGYARDADLYAYVVSLATREFLARERFMRFLEFARDAGALEVHLLEPSATGRLEGRTDVLLDDADRQRIIGYQMEVAGREDLPILSSFTYLESADAFGCGAGLSHIYIDGSGEVCPCNLVPLSFGNLGESPLHEILSRMGGHFRRPRCRCVGRTVAGRLPSGQVPAPPDISEAVCRECLPADHDVPRFFRFRSEATARVGTQELRAAYNRVHGEYDEFWVAQAGPPVDELISRLRPAPGERVFEAGCGTGYATARLAARVSPGGKVLAVDISEGMLAEARQRLGDADCVEFLAGDALEALRLAGEFNVVFSTWVLGYIPLGPFFRAASDALRSGGRLAFVVHVHDSPRRETALFAQIVAEDPSALLKQVDFDFPRDGEHVRSEVAAVGLDVQDLHEGKVTFEYPDAQGALEHLLKSGAGTAFYDAIDPAKRPGLEAAFVDRLLRLSGGGPCRVVHDYVACVATKR